MSSFVFAWYSLCRQPPRAVLAIAGVAVIGALLFDMLLLSQGMLISFRGLLGEVGFDARVMATSSMPMKIRLDTCLDLAYAVWYNRAEKS